MQPVDIPAQRRVALLCARPLLAATPEDLTRVINETATLGPRSTGPYSLKRTQDARDRSELALLRAFNDSAVEQDNKQKEVASGSGSKQSVTASSHPAITPELSTAKNSKNTDDAPAAKTLAPIPAISASTSAIPAYTPMSAPSTHSALAPKRSPNSKRTVDVFSAVKKLDVASTSKDRKGKGREEIPEDFDDDEPLNKKLKKEAQVENMAKESKKDGKQTKPAEGSNSIKNPWIIE